jgi:hypothetical protein
VPSVAGISHSPKELTHWQDCTNGANVLLESKRQTNPSVPTMNLMMK